MLFRFRPVPPRQDRAGRAASARHRELNALNIEQNEWGVVSRESCAGSSNTRNPVDFNEMPLFLIDSRIYTIGSVLPVIGPP
jgi:hypothetical protein